MENLTDKELLKKVRLGSERAFSVLFDRYKSMLFRHIYQRIKSVVESEEILQNIFISVWKNRETIVIDNSVCPYLMGAAKNCIFEFYARTAKDLAHSQLFLALPEPIEYPAEDFIVARELEYLIDIEIQKLPLTMQQIFILSRKQHTSIREIASILNLSEQTVKNNITLALKHLRLKLDLKYVISFFLWLCF